MLLTSRLAGLLLAALVLGGCTDRPEETVSASQSRRPSVPVAIATPSPTVTRQPSDRLPFFRDRQVRALWWKARAGSCLRYKPPYKDRPIYYDRFPRLELVSCTSRLVTHVVTKRYPKHGACPAGQARYRLDHPAMSHKVVMTLCLRAR